jgi:hypothetical protein
MPKRPTRQAAALAERIGGVSHTTISPCPKEDKTGPTRIMYMECKGGRLVGSARIGRVRFSKTWKTVYYQGQSFQRIPGGGFKSNYFDRESRCDYWISGPKKDGGDRLYRERLPIEIDEDVREEYWCEIRNQPERSREKLA